MRLPLKLLTTLSTSAIGICLSLPCFAYDLHDNAILHAQRGQLYLERAQYTMAAEEYKAAILLNPYTSMAASLYNNLGVAYRESGKQPLAIASFQHACRIQPGNQLFYKNLVESYAVSGQTGQAEQELKVITTQNPDDADAWLLLGLLYKEQGRKKAARDCIERFIKLRPESELAKTARTAL